jgi:hypothetical protein
VHLGETAAVAVVDGSVAGVVTDGLVVADVVADLELVVLTEVVLVVTPVVVDGAVFTVDGTLVAVVLTFVCALPARLR